MFVIAKDIFTCIVSFSIVFQFLFVVGSSQQAQSTYLPQNPPITPRQVHCVVMKVFITLSFFIGEGLQSMSTSFMQDFHFIREKEYHLLSTQHVEFGYFTFLFLQSIAKKHMKRFIFLVAKLPCFLGLLNIPYDNPIPSSFEK